MTLVHWTSAAVLGVPLLLNLAIAGAALLLGARQPVSRAFALFALAKSAWLALSLALLVALWLGDRDTTLVKATRLTYILLGPLLFAFVVRLSPRATRLPDAIVAATMAVVAGLILALPAEALFSDVAVTAADQVVVTTTPAAWPLLQIGAPFVVAAWAVMWRQRRAVHPTLLWGTLLVGTAYILNSVSAIGAELMLMSLVGSLLLCFAVATDHLLHPLRRQNEQLLHEIEERRAAQEAFQQTEEVLKLAQQLGRIGHYVIDIQRDQIDISDQIYRIMGYEPGEIPAGRARIEEHIHPDDRQLVWDAMALARPGTSATAEARVLTREGSARDVIFNCVMLPGPDGAPARLVGTVQDITELKRARQAERAQAARFKALADTALDAYYEIDREGGILDVNDEACRMLGYARDELLRMRILDVDSSTNLDLLREQMSRLKEGGVSQRFETRHRHRQGHILDVEINAAYVPDIDRGICFVRDVTVQKRVVAALRESEARYREMHEQLPIGLAVSDLEAEEGRTLYLNPAIVEMTGYSIEDLPDLRTAFERFFPDPERRAQLEQTLRAQVGASREGGLLPTSELEVSCRDGTTRTVECRFRVSEGMLHTLMTDVTERVRAVRALQASEERFRILSERLPIGLAIHDMSRPRGPTVYLNPAHRELFGFSADEIPDLFAALERHHLAPEDLAAAHDSLTEDLGAEAVESDRPRVVRLGTKGGEVKTVEIVPRRAGDLLYVLLTDITARVESERALREGEQRLRLALSASQQVMYDLDLRTEVIVTSADYAAMLGYEPGAFELSMDWLAANIHPEDLARATEGLVACVLGERTSFQSEYRVRGGDGGWRWVQVIGSVVEWDEAGRPARMLGLTLDITARKETEAEIRRLNSDLELRVIERTQQLHVNETLLRTVFETAPVPLAIADMASGELTMGNQRLFEMARVPAEQLLGRPTTQWFKDDADRWAILSELLERGSVRNREVELRLDDGTALWASLSLELVTLPEGKAVLTGFHDITQRKQAELMLRQSEEALRLANAELKRAARAKDEFLANMSHELRTPLNGVLGLAETLLEQAPGPLTPRQDRLVRGIESSGRHLLELINDILDLAKIEADKLDLQIDSVPVEEVCRAALAFVKELATKKSITVGFRCEPAMLWMQADARRLKQILINLLGNAVKFTEAGGQIGLEVLADVDQQLVRFSVEDTGIGIASADMPKLFQPFTQLDSSLARQHQGTGLGLVLVRRLTELHGGTVAVSSEPGAGSRFTVTIPWRSAPERPAAEQPPQDAEQVPAPAGAPAILLAEDNPINVEVIGGYLSDLGYRVSVARDGGEALAAALAGRPGLILMDIQMPGMDGMSAIQRLRASPEFDRTPIVALTALAMPGDRERCLAAGADEYLSKPVNLRRLSQIVAALIVGGRVPAAR